MNPIIAEQDFAATLTDMNDTDALRKLLQTPEIELIRIPQPPVQETGFGLLCEQLLQVKNFNWAINDQPENIIVSLRKHITSVLEPSDTVSTELPVFLDRVGEIMHLMLKANPGTAHFGLRNFFCPGDAILHLDNMARGKAVRFLWAMGRPSGMKYTCRSNVNVPLYWDFIHRELHLIRRMDAIVFGEGKTIDEVWAHRPRQVSLLKNEKHHYMLDASKLEQVPVNWSSIHYVDTPDFPGTFHCNTFRNAEQPGLQLLFTTVNQQ